MSSLDLLTPFLRGPVTITCPRIALLARDFEPPIVEDSGTFTVASENEFTYEMVGKAPDLGHTLRALNQHEADRYDGLNHFRLVMWDADGREWLPAVDENEVA